MFVFSKCLTFIAFALVEVSFAWFNVVDFGAIGDGVTDNTQVFRKVSELVKLNNGGEIFVPKGIYVFFICWLLCADWMMYFLNRVVHHWRIFPLFPYNSDSRSKRHSVCI